MNKTPNLTTDEWQRALDHRWLVDAVVAQRRLHPTIQDDARQDGFIGLCRAIANDTGSPATFNSYAAFAINQAITAGIARMEGIGFRQHLGLGYHRPRRPTPFEWPLSIDGPLPSSGKPRHDDDPETIALSLRSDDDPEGQALAHLAHEHLVGILISESLDTLDLDVGLALAADPDAHRTELDRMIAAAHQVPATRVADRRRRLRARAAARLEAA